MVRAQAFVIHLEKAVARRPQVDVLLRALPLPACVIDAVDGRGLSESAVEAHYVPNLLRPRYPFALRRTEIGCFLSHRKAWAAICESGLEAGLIVEDDVALDDPGFRRAWALAMETMTPDDYIRFPFRSYTDKGRSVAETDGVRLLEPALPGAGMQVQLVGRAVAARLLERTVRFDRPVDSFIQMRWLTGVRTLAVQPSGIHEMGAALGGTLVQKKAKPLSEVVSRAVSRALYRSRLRMAALRHPVGTQR